MARIAINGFGRIGRQVFKALVEFFPNSEIVAINDIASPETLAHLLRFDSNYGRYNKSVSVSDKALIVDGRKITCLQERDINSLPWTKYEIDIVIEASGIFKDRDKAGLHLKNGAKKVLITAPSKDPDLMIVRGVNDSMYDPSKHHIISNASCTTNSLAPLVKVLNDKFKVEYGFMTTIHSYTGDQRLLDAPHGDMRRARNAATNIVPTSTGAAGAVAKVIPELAGKLTGISVRVPTQVVSLTDFVCQVQGDISEDRVNIELERACREEMKGILSYSEEPLVSSDYIGSPYSGVVDALSTMVLGTHLVKLCIWYDNEWAYSIRIAEVANMLLGE